MTQNQTYGDERNRGGKDCIVQGADNKAQISETLCIDCGICIKKCPFKAISIINLPHVLTQDPVYRYGVNKFELFRLPIPHKGKIVGCYFVIPLKIKNAYFLNFE